jgi:CrcB protein
MKIFAIAIGGISGALLRYWVSGIFSHLISEDFPWGTLSVNLIGSFLIGLLWAIFSKRLYLTPELRALIFIGFLGSFTTFSSYALESLNLFRNNEIKAAVLNILYNNIFGLFAVILGTASAYYLIKLLK